MCLFLSMVVWQPFQNCWRLIIARVSEMHVAYHISTNIWVTSSSELTNKSKINEITPTHFFTSYLYHRGGL
jgi:hypothetical protein